MTENTNSSSVKNLILGAGLSGLSAAYFLGDDYLIIEKDSTPGGYCRTIPNKQFVWDYAGHFYHFRTKKYKNLFLSMVEPEEIIQQKKNTKIYYQGKLIDYPFQTNIHELEKNEFIDCLYDLYFREKDAKYNNFLDMLYAKFGHATTEKFLRPYNEKLYATDLHSLDKDAMGRFFPYADFDAVIKNMKQDAAVTYNDNFMYLKKGTGYFIKKLYSCLDPSKILFNTEVISINPEQKLATTSSGQIIHYENLISTIPANQFLSLFGDKYSNLKDSLSYNQVLVLNLGFDAPSPRFKSEHWLYFPDKSLNFYRISFYNNILGTSPLSVYVEIGFPKEATNINVDAELAKTLDGMKQTGIINDSMHLVDHNAIIMNPAYVHIANSTDDALKKLFSELERDQIYTLGRYGRWTYNSMEDCISLADSLIARL